MTEAAVLNLANLPDWEDIKNKAELIQRLETEVLPPYVNTCRWFAGKARQPIRFQLRQIHPVPVGSSVAYLTILGVEYSEGDAENYLLPLGLLESDQPEARDIPPKGIMAKVKLGNGRGLLIDAMYDERFREMLYGFMASQHTLAGPDGDLQFLRGRGLAEEDLNTRLPSRVLPVDSSNSALVFGNKYFVKLYRKLFSETNPEVETVSFITEHSNFDHIPAYAGSVVLKQEGAPDVTLVMMQLMVENRKDSWDLTGDYLNDFLYQVPQRMFSIREEVFDMVELLGQRTGELHCALYNQHAGPEFAPEPFTDEYREFIIGRIEHLLEGRYNLLIDNYTRLDPLAQRLAWVFMEAKELIDDFVADFRCRPIESLRIRIHGDYHLGQVLATQNDFVIIDFEGEPESSITERKIKHSPLKDVAGMVRSYHYAVSAKLFGSAETAGIEADQLQRVSDRWFKLIRDTFMDAYLETIGSPHPLFKDNAEINFLLLIYLLEKAVYELGYEISYRPHWVKIPLKGIVDVIREIEKIRIADGNLTNEGRGLPTGLLQTKKA